MKKVVAYLLALIMAGSLMSGAGVTIVKAAEGEEGLAAHLTLAIQDPDKEIWEQVIADFNEVYPDITIELVTFLDYVALNQNVMATHQAGDDYDLAVVNHVDALAYIKGELLYPLDDMLEEEGLDVDSIILGDLEDMGKLGDSTYTVPINTDTRIICYNTDLFEKYDLELPTTMDEMLEAGKVISEANQGDYVYSNAMCNGGDYFSTYDTGMFLQSCGGQLYTVDENGVATATIDTDEMRMYLNFITELLPYMPEECITNNMDATRSAFCEGYVGMYQFGPWDYGQMDMESLEFNYTLMKVPEGPAGSVSTSGGYQLGIGSGTKNPEAALAFMKYILTNPECMALIGLTGLPTVESAYEEEPFNEEKYKVFMEQLESSNLPQMPVANLGEVVACFSGYWNDLCVGNITVDEMIAEAQPAVQALLDENN